MVLDIITPISIIAIGMLLFGQYINLKSQKLAKTQPGNCCNHSIKYKFLDCLIPVIIITVILNILYFFRRSHNPTRLSTIIMFGLTVAICFLIFLYWSHQKTLSPDKILCLIFIIGVMIRICFVFNNDVYPMQHDVFGTYGHQGYITHIADTWTLPDNNISQFYHPPLFHVLSAIVFSLTRATFKGDGFAALSAVQFFMIEISLLMILMFNYLLKKVKIPDNWRVFGVSIFILYPQNILFSRVLNNDLMFYFFYLLSLITLIRWFESRKNIDMVACALSVSLGTLSKVSMIAFGLILALVFLTVLIMDRKKFLCYTKQYLIFLGIFLTLGCSFIYRNYILFKQSPLYVLDIGANSGQYITAEPAKRILTFPLKEFFAYPFCKHWEDYNIWQYMIKCSVFGEYWFELTNIIKILAYSLLILSFICIAIFIFSLIISFYKTSDKKEEIINKIFLLIFVFNILTYVMFCIQYPQGCSMDFRYITPIIFSGCYFIAKGIPKTLEFINNRRVKVLVKTLLVLPIILFLSLSVIFYLLAVNVDFTI